MKEKNPFKATLKYKESGLLPVTLRKFSSRIWLLLFLYVYVNKLTNIIHKKIKLILSNLNKTRIEFTLINIKIKPINPIITICIKGRPILTLGKNNKTNR